MFFSPSLCSFFPRKLRSDYERAGNWPTDAIEVAQNEWETYGLGRPPSGMQRGADETGHPTWVPIPPPELDTLAASQRRKIESALASALSAGMPYTMPDGTADVVQMRGEDRQNLLGLAIEARDLKATGVTDPVQAFRAQSNNIYLMTPDQAITMTDAVLSHYKALMQQSWERKDAIDDALVAGNRAAIEAVTW